MQSALSGPITKPINNHDETTKKKPIHFGVLKYLSKTPGKSSAVCLISPVSWLVSWISASFDFSKLHHQVAAQLRPRLKLNPLKSVDFRRLILIGLFKSLTSLNREHRAGGVMSNLLSYWWMPMLWWKRKSLLCFLNMLNTIATYVTTQNSKMYVLLVKNLNSPSVIHFILYFLLGTIIVV